MPEATFCITVARKDGSTSYSYPETERLARDAFEKRCQFARVNPHVISVTLRFIDHEGESRTLDSWEPA